MDNKDDRMAMGGLATGGMLWVSAGTVASKCASLAAQLVLGWVLSSNDFALYAIAISWSTIVLALRNAGTQRLLIQRGNRWDEFATICLKVSLVFNGLGFILLAAAAPLLSQIYQSDALRPVIWIIAASLPLSTVSLIFQAKLSSDLRFGKLTRINMWSAILRHTLTATLAFLGFGPISFVLPLILIAIFETVAGWSAVGTWPLSRPLTWQATIDVLQDSRWVMLTSLAGVLAMNGDYLAISLLQSKDTLGIYYFGFQLSFSMAALFTNGVEAVMMPAFSRLDNDQERQRAAFFKAVRVLMLGTTLSCFALVLGARPLIHELWNGKWDSAIPVVQILALSLPVKMMIPLCRSLLEGRGQWRVVAVLLLADGMGTVMAGAVGAWAGGLTMIAAVVSIYNLVFGLVFCGFVTTCIGERLRDMFVPLLSTLAIGLLALTATSVVTRAFTIDSSEVWASLGLIGGYLAVYFGLTRCFLKHSAAEAISLFQRHMPGIWLLKRTT